MILVDSSFLFSLLYSKESKHKLSIGFASETLDTLVVPEVALTEVASVDYPDLTRAAAIMRTYPEARLDFVDCTIMAISERLGVTDICTYDRRDFALVRPAHCDYYNLYP